MPQPLVNNPVTDRSIATQDAVSSLAATTADLPTLDLELINKHLFTAILWTDAQGNIQWANTQAEQLFSASQTRLLERNALTLLQVDKSNQSASLDLSKRQDNAKDITTIDAMAALQNQFQHALTYQQPFIDHDQLICGIQHSVLVDYSVTPVEDQGRQYFLIELWEKNRQSRISQEQRQQEQHHIARQMLRAVAHEVKNPLAGIRGAAQLLIKQVNNLNLKDSTGLQMPLGNKIHTYADIIISETDRLTQLIGKMLGSHRLADWQSVNIHEPLEHVLTLTHSQHPTIVISRDYDLSLPELTADKDQLIQVFLNLINNACEAMLQRLEEEDYLPTLSVRTRVEFQHTIGAVQHKQVLKIDIHDNGIGIDAEMLGKIFLPLVTGRANGTGLGLALVQDMISRHQGAIDVVSNVGNTTFSLYLPFHQQGD